MSMVADLLFFGCYELYCCHCAHYLASFFSSTRHVISAINDEMHPSVIAVYEAVL